MTFSSPAFFLIFLPLSLLGFQLFGRFGRRGAIGFLTLMSFIFYAQWSVVYLWLLVGSILFNYTISRLIATAQGKERTQTGWLVFGISCNLLALTYFKYLFPTLGFFTQRGWMHHDFGSVILPLGISFFTFTQIAYLVDLKQGVAQRESLLSYCLFVTYFPHLIAGPIIHHKEMMPQFRQERRYRLDRSDVALGLTWFTMGMFKKIMIADRLTPMVDRVFWAAPINQMGQAWVGVLAYSLELYFDFSGYSDMAVGLARMFSIRFPFNFNSPYKAASIIDFWQRWHMTLTSYIMDYVYGPLQFRVSRRRLDQGKKISKKAMSTPEGFVAMVATPTLITMFLAGVWHGAGLQFVVFGVLHGVYLVINHAWRIFVPHDSPLQKPLVTPVSIGLTYAAVLVAEVFFRSPDVATAFSILTRMAGLHGVGPAVPVWQIALLAGLYAIIWLMPNTQEILGETLKDDRPNWSILPSLRWQPTIAWLVPTSLMFTLCMLYSTASSTFLYFQF